MTGPSHNAIGSVPKNVGSLADLLRELAEPTDRGEKIHTIIERAARRADLPKWRAFDIWYGKARRVTDDEKLRVAAALEKKRREATRRELQDLRLRIAALESRLVQTDADFHRVDIDALGVMLRGGGRGAD